MKVVFRFRDGFRKIEEWNSENKSLRFYYKILKSRVLLGVSLNELSANAWSDEPYAEVYTFRLIRVFFDENDIETAIYDCEEKLI